MDRKTVLVVTSNTDQSDELQEVLEDSFEVLHANQAQLAVAVFGSIRPWAVVVSMKQKTIDGVSLCRELRNRLGGTGCFFLVYDPRRKSLDKPREEPSKNTPFGVDSLMIGPELPTSMIKAKLHERLSTQPPRKRPAPKKPSLPTHTPLSSDGPTIQNLMDSGVSQAEIRIALLQDEEASSKISHNTPWKELLKEQISLRTLKVLLTKDVLHIGPKPPENPPQDLATLTWGQLLNSRVNTKTLKAIIHKTVGTESTDQEHPAEENTPPQTPAELDRLRRAIQTLEERNAELEAQLEFARNHNGARPYNTPRPNHKSWSPLDDPAEKALRSVMDQLLPLFDQFSQSLGKARKTNDPQLFGREMLQFHKDMRLAFLQFGIERFDCLGQPFDPDRHEVAETIPSEKHPAGIVLEVQQNGYTHNGELLRPAVVVVSEETPS